MNQEELKKLLESIQKGDTDIDTGIQQIKNFTYSELGYAKIDHHRELRTGYPEVVFGENKSVEHLIGIARHFQERQSNLLITRITADRYNDMHKAIPELTYNSTARAVMLQYGRPAETESFIAVITAGTSDYAVAEEAAVTASFFGNRVERLFDVGVAGVHRLFNNWELIKNARVYVVVAGMEGALPSIIGGLVDKPVIAVPTSVGYGANFNGLSALLGMLTSCASGVSVVNIDNGFGAGYLASMINKL
ncbi:MAG: nickel pincer cofactor biosynthesis protein LarB [Bacteroidetes bacterium]|jgi:NCAIR mutase (PurE)-related protein|nr:nickel pincer cofactor biosynthesis protein LarB [Bacteroidota bacterium]